MRKFFVFVIVIILLSCNAYAHPGKTDSNGGHHDYNNVSGLGDYHYHHGHPAHLHENGECPYSNDDNISHVLSTTLSTSDSTNNSFTYNILSILICIFVGILFALGAWWSDNPIFISFSIMVTIGACALLTSILFDDWDTETQITVISFVVPNVVTQIIQYKKHRNFMANKSSPPISAVSKLSKNIEYNSKPENTKKNKVLISTFQSKTTKNLKHLQKVFEQIIDEMENNINDLNPSCKPVLMQCFKKITVNAENEAAKWGDNFNYKDFSYNLIYKLTAELLSSGQFHIYRGMLNPMNESSHLLSLFEQCLDWHVAKGTTDERWKRQQMDTLRRNIANAG